MPAFPALPALHTLPALPAFPATTGALPYAAPEASPALTSIAGPTLWWVTIAAVVALLALDFVITRRPHEVTMREALAWSAFYIAIPVGFGVWIWTTHGNQTGLEYYTGYLVEKSLSVDNLFIFLLLLTAFAVPKELQQRSCSSASLARSSCAASSSPSAPNSSRASRGHSCSSARSCWPLPSRSAATPSPTPTTPSTSARYAASGSSAGSGPSATPTTAHACHAPPRRSQRAHPDGPGDHRDPRHRHRLRH